MSNIYELMKEMKEFESLDFDQESELYLDTLEAIELPIKAKADAIVRISRNDKARVLGLDVEIKRLQNKKKVLVNKTANMLTWLAESMDMTNTDKIETELFTITKRQLKYNTLNILDETIIPEEYEKFSITYDKAGMKKFLKANPDKTIEGVELVDSAVSVMIK